MKIRKGMPTIKSLQEVCVNAGYETELGIARWLYFGAISVLTKRKINASNCPPSIDKGQTNHTNQL
jgi:hypothetical protein